MSGPSITFLYNDQTRNGCRLFLAGGFMDLFLEHGHGLHDHQRVVVRGLVLMRPKEEEFGFPVCFKAKEREMVAGVDQVSGILCMIQDASLLQALDVHFKCLGPDAPTKRTPLKLSIVGHIEPEFASVYLGNRITRHRAELVAGGAWP